MSYAIASSTSATHAVIEPLISSAWVTLGYTADTIAWPNATFTKPGNGPWLRVSYPDQSTTPFDWGGGVVLNTTTAVLALQIFSPKNIGSGVINAAVDLFRATFERKHYGTGIRFYETLGPQDIGDAVWAGASLQFPYHFEEAITL